MELEMVANDANTPGLLQLPLELFTQIASGMTPYDILKLARSSKTLRRFFMSKTLSEHIWVAARKAMGIPDIPHFNEPFYADLLFDKKCYTKDCKSSKAEYVSFELGVRLCHDCLFKGDTNGVARYSCLYEGGKQRKFNCIGVLPKLRIPEEGTHSPRTVPQYIVEGFAKLLGRCRSSEEKRVLVNMYRTRTEKLRTIAKRVEHWAEEERAREAKARRALRTSHERSITARLLEMGYTKEDLETKFDDEDFAQEWFDILRRPTLFTLFEWNEILPRLIEMIGARRIYSIPARRERMLGRIEYLYLMKRMVMRMGHATKIFTSDEVYEQYPELKAMLDDPKYCGPIPEGFGDGIEGAVNALVKNVEDNLVAKLNAAYLRVGGLSMDNSVAEELQSVPDENTSTQGSRNVPLILRLATSFFHDKSARSSLASYATLLRTRSLACFKSSQNQWLEGISVPQNAIVIAKALLRHLSISETSTMLFLQKLGMVFVCERCAKYDRCTRMSWERLVKHYYDMNELHEERLRKRQELGIDMVILNDHDLSNGDGENTFASMTNRGKIVLGSYPASLDDVETYEDLGRRLLCERGHEVDLTENCSVCTKERNESCEIDYDGLYTSDNYCPMFDDDGLPRRRAWSCELCEKLGVDSSFFESEIEAHVEQVHGCKIYDDYEASCETSRNPNPAHLIIKRNGCVEEYASPP
ncbi:hypothetical protein SCHPADRAFT_993552 [Schizopora paradoxa]|uniref:F-box domain-containing protein n=1 Tax=Schizopora paradoxa TaxID=27342 RepID=A0A0H2S2H8_9AGAM|nr:hypothetical protein SCHPADRAFT_993552 [Schizopora paradoxa]